MIFSKKYQIIFLLLILSLAVFFRFWQIGSIPPGLYPDEAINGNDARQTLENGQFNVFYPENNGREGVFIWLISLSFYLFGSAIWSLRLVSAVFGVLTVLGLYLLAQELFNKKIALASSFFLAVSFWHTNFSRISFRAILVPFLLCFSFYFLWRAFHRNTLSDYIWSGLFFGLGFYTYIAFRMAVLILGLVLLMRIIDYWLKNKYRQISWPWAYFKGSWWKVDVFLLTIFIVALPIGLHFLNYPQDFLGRAGGVSVFSQENPYKEIFLSTVKTLGMFNLVGDQNWRHNLAGQPMLSWPIGLLFIIGLVLVIKNLFKDRDTSVFLIGWFLIMLLPSILTCEGLPHALRTIGVIPVVYILAALGLALVFRWVSKINRLTAFLIIGFLLVYPALDNFNKYFFKWAQDPNVPGAFRQDLVKLTDSLKDWPAETKKYIIVNEPGVRVPYPDGLPMPAQTIIFQSEAKNLPINYLAEDQKSWTDLSQPALIVLLKKDASILEQLSKTWPDGIIKQINEFTAYQIK